MPEYLAPGVFIEETSFRSKSIEGVGTSVSSLVGPTRTGPLRGAPEVVTSYAEFERIFGDASDLVFTGVTDPVPNYTAHAARAFFDNGGKQLYVARIVQGVNTVASNGSGSSAAVAKSDATKTTDVSFQARFPGAVGNYTLELHWKESENLLTSTQLGTADDTETVFIDATAVPAAAKTTGPANDKFPVNVKGVFKRNGANYEVVGTALVTDPISGEAVTGTALAGLKIADLPAATTHVYRIRARRPANGVLADGTPAVLTLKKAVDLTALNAAWVLGSAKEFKGVINEKGDTLKLAAAKNPSLAADLELPLAALGNNLADIKSVAACFFDLDVHRGNKNGEVIWRAGNITVAPGTAQSLDKVLTATPEKKSAQLSQPISCTLAASVTSAKVLAALDALYDQASLKPPADSLDNTRYIIALAGGTDGKEPEAIDYAGEEDDANGSTGLAALEGIDDISIVLTPAAAATSNHKAVLMEVQKHCRKMRYRIGIADSGEGMSIGDVRAFRNEFDDSRLALYYPWVVIADPTGKRKELAVPPSGFIAGICVRTDVDRGVHKAPANEVVMGALRFEQDINKFQQELLNPNGVNCLRSFPGRGHRVWGGRTLSSDPEWKYVNVRRYFLYLERSIEKSTQWAVFEPNGEALWGNIRSAVEDFLFNEWKNGRLLGGTPKEAYFVRCDRSTMTQNDIDNGRMVCVVGVAALTPAEFVIFRIGQKTADA